MDEREEVGWEGAPAGCGSLGRLTRMPGSGLKALLGREHKTVSEARGPGAPSQQPLRLARPVPGRVWPLLPAVPLWRGAVSTEGPVCFPTAAPVALDSEVVCAVLCAEGVPLACAPHQALPEADT